MVTEVGRVLSDQALVASPSSPQAVSTEGFDPSRCSDCGGPHPPWFAPNEIWNLVMGGPDAKGDPGGYCCATCFMVRAEAAGVDVTWEVRPPARSLRAELDARESHLLARLEPVYARMAQLDAEHAQVKKARKAIAHEGAGPQGHRPNTIIADNEKGGGE